MNKKLVFINYISRSGSTLLCQLLDAYTKISVGIEAGFPGHPTQILPHNKQPIKSEIELDTYLDRLYSDIRFKEWNIDRTTYKSQLLNTSYPINFKNILETALSLNLSNNAEIWVHKAGYFIGCLEEARSTFTDAQHIYIQRDPRAIFNSQKHAKSIYHNRPMAINVINFINQYHHRACIAKSNKDKNDFLFIQYEDLLSNQTKVINSVIDFINLEDKDKKEASDYSKRIPDNQKQLHTNVSSTVNNNSLHKWRKDLSDVEIRIIEYGLSDLFKEYNYPKSDNIKLNTKELIEYSLLKAKLVLSRLKHAR